MGWYADHIEPRAVDCLCGMKTIGAQRELVVPRASGRVLEIGFGTGLNIGHYDAARIERLWALEPSAKMRNRASARIDAAPFDVELLDAPGERIPLASALADSVVITYTMCTIPDVERALEEVRRVLRPGGSLLFCEHGRSPDAGVAKWQDRLNGGWKRIAGGCHINRDVRGLLTSNGFELASFASAYLPRTPRVLGYHCWGAALAR